MIKNTSPTSLDGFTTILLLQDYWKVPSMPATASEGCAFNCCIVCTCSLKHLLQVYAINSWETVNRSLWLLLLPSSTFTMPSGLGTLSGLHQCYKAFPCLLQEGFLCILGLDLMQSSTCTSKCTSPPPPPEEFCITLLLVVYSINQNLCILELTLNYWTFLFK